MECYCKLKQISKEEYIYLILDCIHMKKKEYLKFKKYIKRHIREIKKETKVINTKHIVLENTIIHYEEILKQMKLAKKLKKEAKNKFINSASIIGLL